MIQDNDQLTRFIDSFQAIPPREELDIFSDGDHVVAFSKPEWDFVVKVLKEENDPGLLQRHKEALCLTGLVAEFRIIEQGGRIFVIQEKISSFLHEHLLSLAEAGKLAEAKGLVTDYIEFNLSLWKKGRFDWHFRINHCGLDGMGRVVAFDIGGIRGKPDLRERIRWLFGYFGRKHRKNTDILNSIHPELARFYIVQARKKLTRRAAEKAIFS